jgi:hypothetical protein
VPRLRAWALGQSEPAAGPGELPNVQDAPTRDEVREEVARLRSYVPQEPMNWQDLDPEQARAWGEQAIRNWARDNHVPLSEAEVQAAALGYAEEEFGVAVPENVREAREMGIEIAVTEACSQLGVEAELGYATYEALRDGDLDRSDCEAMGRTAGAMAGAAIGQAYGIPAPIGAYVGGQIGGSIGTWFADSFHVGQSARERRTAQIEARQEAIQDWFEAQCQQCARIKRIVGTNHQAYLNELIRLWLKCELEIGVRFGLRWFGVRPWFLDWRFTHQQNPYSCWHSYHYQRGWSNFSSRAACEAGSTTACSLDPTACTQHGVQCRPVERRTIHGHSERQQTSTGVYSGLACFCAADYGCAYPAPAGTPEPASVSRALDARLAAQRAREAAAQAASSAARRAASTQSTQYVHGWSLHGLAGGAAEEADVVVKAIAALGEPDLDFECELEAPGAMLEYYAMNSVERTAWMERVVAQINDHVRFNRQLAVHYRQVLMDLLRTAAIVQAETTVAEERVELETVGTNTLRVAAERGARKRAWLNTLVLGAGIGALGYVLLRRRRR